MTRQVTMFLPLLVAFLAGCAGGQPEQSLMWDADAQAFDFDPASDDPATAHPSWCDVPDPFPVAVLETNFGEIRIDLFDTVTPVTVQNFIDLAESGFYNDTIFPRIITGFMMQGGTPDGTLSGGPGYSIKDEFHPLVKHEGRGVLSMANSGPNTGGSQFFITFADTPHLDGAHSIFGHVSSGWTALDSIEAQASSQSGTPKTAVELRSVTIEHPAEHPANSLRLWTPHATHPARPGGTTQFIAVVENDGDSAAHVCLAASSADLEVAVEEDFLSFVLGAGQSKTFIVDAKNTGTAGDLTVTAHTAGAGDKLTLTVEAGETGALVQEGQEVTAHYIGMTTHGKVFDTSVQSVANLARDEDLGFTTFRHRGQYQAFSFAPGEGVIGGFTDLAVRLESGATGVDRVPADDAYGRSGGHPLSHRDLIFQLEIIHAA